MPDLVLARRTAAVGAILVLALGACGVAASAAFADVTPTATAAAELTDASEAGGATYTLANNGAGSFSLAITIPGTSIAVDYTVDPTGAVTGATTSTAGATVTVDGHDLTITLADGRAVKVELGDAGDAVTEVSLDTPSGGDNPDQNQQADHGDGRDQQGSDNAVATTSQDQQGDNENKAPTSQPSPEPEATESSDSNQVSAATSAPEPQASDSSDGTTQDSGSPDSTDTSGGSSDSSGGGSDSGD